MSEPIEKYMELCAAMYQFAGAHDAPLEWLNTLYAAAEGMTFSVEGLLPYVKEREPS